MDCNLSADLEWVGPAEYHISVFSLREKRR